MPHLNLTHLTCFLIAILLLTSLPLSNSYSISGNTITDLWANDASLGGDASGWQMTSSRGNGITYQCGSAYLLGGYAILGGTKGEYFYRWYAGAPSHNQVKLTMMFYPIDSWDGTTTDDHFEIGFDNDIRYAWKLSAFAGYATQSCGSSNWLDYPPIQVYMNIPHTATAFYFKVISQLDEASDNESFGFRQITMVFQNVGSPAYSLCGIADDSPLPDKMCGCTYSNQYMSPPNSGKCYYCESTCLTCNGGASTNCQSCAAGRYMSSNTCPQCAPNCATCNGGATTNCQSCVSTYPYIVNNNECVATCVYPYYTEASGSNTACKTPCPGQFALWDAQCSSVCSDIWLTQRLSNTFWLCEYPCLDTQYLYYDGVCDNSCPSPLKIRGFHGKNYCDHSCSTTTDYLYWDVLCESYCNYPLTYISPHGRKICQYPCANNQYLYWDQFCGETCYFPQIIRVFHGKQFCDFPCAAGQFLYWNNTCLSDCVAPLITRNERSVKYCDYPCSGTQYLFWNNSCLPTCDFPLNARVVGSSRFCDYPCQSNQVLHWLGTCVSSSSCLAPRIYASEGTPTRLFCYYPCTTSQYLYWNGTCRNACNPPLNTVVQESRNFCTYPCTNGYFLYWYGTCLSTCPAPLKQRVEASLNYCDYPCTDSNYLYWDGSCLSSCNAPLSPRTTNGKLFCDFPCSPTTWYLYWPTSPSTCRSTCPSILTTRTELSKNYCDFPCSGSDYLYWNGSCISSCPLFTRTVDLSKNFCSWPCTYTSDYVYWDGSCSSNCDAPLTRHTEGTSPVRNFCDYPCEASVYLYWDGRCLSTCDAPLSPRIQNSRKFCGLPCAQPNFLYWNGSCLSSCSFPLTQRLETTANYCDYPCQLSEYLYWNGSCIASCDAPLTKRPVLGNNFCDYKCSTSQYLYWDGTCSSSCSAPLTQIVEGTSTTRKFCRFGCDSNEYLYWDASCSASCDYPLTNYQANSRSFCTYPCSTTQYLYWNQDCQSSCPTTHTSRVTNSRNFCDFPCTGSNILYWDSRCLPTCDFPLVSSSSRGKSYCTYPCTGNDYLYWDRSCQSTCNPPLSPRVDASKNYCDYPCTGSNMLYWDGSCLPTCPTYHITRQTNSKYFCDYKCQLSEYLYWNGSCISTCTFPLSPRVDHSRNYCDYPCASNQYLYWNGSCLGTCAIPLDTRIDAGDKYCDYKCTPSQILQWDGVCTTQCDSPRTLRTVGTPARNFCTFDCPINQFLYWNLTCATTCKFPLKTKVLNSRLFCEYPCTVGQYLNWNGTCLSYCPLPYVSRIEASLAYCYYPCSASEFLYWNGTCSAACAFPLVQSISNTKQFCNFPCDDTEFLYWDGTCSSTCPPPLTQLFEGGKKFCNYKCTNPTDYLYWNSTCLSTCNSPLIPSFTHDKKLCSFPCDLSKYLYWDGTCLSYCNAPLTPKIEGNAKYCSYGCTSSQYLYWNGSCLSTCGNYFTTRAERGYYFCDYPCGPTEHLYWNGSCIAGCPEPFTDTTPKQAGSKKFCDFPCTSTQYWSTWDKKCIGHCASPLIPSISGEGRYCLLPCTNSSYYYYLELSQCKSDCPSPYITNTTLPYKQCLPAAATEPESETEPTVGGTLFNALLVAPVGNGTLTLVKVVKVMQYLRFLDIKLPPRLERFGSSQGRGILSFGTDSRRVLIDKSGATDLVKSSLPSVFTRNNLDSSFVVNYWGTLLFILSAVAAGVIFTVLEKIAQKLSSKMFEEILKVLRVITRWNLVIMLVASSIDDIILYTSLEIRSIGSTPTDTASYFSLVLSLIFTAISATLIIGIVMLVRKYKQMKITVYPRSFEAVKFGTKWQDLQVIFRGFTDHKSFNPYFFLIYMIRIGFPMLVTVIAVGAPVVITLVQLLTSIMIIAYLFIMKPFKKKVNQIQLLIFEIIVFIMNLCMFILTILSVTDTDGGDFSVVLGDIVILGNGGINVIAIVFLFIRIILEARTIKRYIGSLKARVNADYVRYLQLIALVFQQTNMGFEELIEDYPTKLSQMKTLQTTREDILDTGSCVTDKTEGVIRLGRGKGMTNQFEETEFDLPTKDENTLAEIVGGYKGTISEENNKKEIKVVKSPAYYPMRNESPSPLISPAAAEDNRLFEFEDSSPKMAWKRGEFKEKIQGLTVEQRREILKRQGSGRMIRRNAETEKRSESPILDAIRVENDLQVKGAEEQEKPEGIVMPSVYQPVVNEKPAVEVSEQSKKFLNYNWRDVEAPMKGEELGLRGKSDECQEKKGE